MKREENREGRTGRCHGLWRTTLFRAGLLRIGAGLLAVLMVVSAVCLPGCSGRPVHTDETDPAGEDTRAETGTLPDTALETGEPMTIADETGTGEPLTEPETEPEKEPDPYALNVPEFSVPGGYVDGRFKLELSLPEGAPEGAYIVYTLDGSEPGAKSDRYKQPITLLNGADAAVVRAAVICGGALCGHIVTNTYLKKGVTSLRVVSLTVDPDDLYGKEGILAHRDLTGKASERPASVEIIEPDGRVLIRQVGGVRLAGAGSRSFDPATIRVVARKDGYFDESGVKYDGAGKFKAALFPGEDCAGYDRFLLRNGGNDSLYQSRSNFLRQNVMRDAIANNVCAALEAQKGVTVFAQREVPAAVYLNGEYYGLLNMKQDFDDDLLEDLYGIPGDGVTIIKGKKNGKQMYYQVEAGDESELDAWQALYAYAADHALAADYADAYAYVSGQLDMDNFVWYIAVMTYLCNTDWPQNNTMVWRYAGDPAAAPAGTPYTDGKWRFVIRDMDLCFALHDAASKSSSTTYTMADTDTLYRLLVFYRDGKGYDYDASTGLYEDAMGFQGLLDFFMRSADFRTRLRAAYDYLMSDAFSTLLTSEMDAYAALCEPEMPAMIRRWQEAGKIHASYTFKTWQSTLRDMKQFVKDRPKYFKDIIKQNFAYYE